MRRIAANYVFPVTGPPVKNGVLTLSDQGTILHIGRLEEEGEDTEFYNGILCPGFINAHCHIELSHLQGRFRQATGMAGFIRQINELRLTAERREREQAAGIQMDNMYRQGVSAVADISNGSETFEIKSRSPLYTRTFIELFGSDPSRAPQILEQGKKLVRQAQTYGLDASLSPHACYSMSGILLEKTAEEGMQSGFLSYHNQESPQEEELLIKGTGPLADSYKERGLTAPPATGKPSLLYFLQHLKNIRSGTIGSKVILVHNTVTGRESIEAALQILQESYWTICPLSNLFIHRRLPPLDLMREKGLNICLGTDSLSSNTVLSIAQEIKCIHRHFPHIPLIEILQWACLGGARALGKEKELGSFEPGKKPGIVLVSAIDWNRFMLTPDSTTTRIL